jgi:hypothetical protein
MLVSLTSTFQPRGYFSWRCIDSSQRHASNPHNTAADRIVGLHLVLLLALYHLTLGSGWHRRKDIFAHREACLTWSLIHLLFGWMNRQAGLFWESFATWYVMLGTTKPLILLGLPDMVCLVPRECEGEGQIPGPFGWCCYWRVLGVRPLWSSEGCWGKQKV